VNKSPGMCQWKDCGNWASILYESAGTKMLLCDTHWDGVRRSIVDVFGKWEHVCRIVEFGPPVATDVPKRRTRKEAEA
jgi:hypothetical protein